MPFQGWIEIVAYLGLGGLWIGLLILPLPGAERVWLGAGVGLYLVAKFRFLLPRSNYAPRLVQGLMAGDILVVGLLYWTLYDYVPALDLVLVPLIVMAGMLCSRDGVLALTGLCVLVDVAPRAWAWTGSRGLPIPPESGWILAVVNAGLVGVSLALTGLMVLFLIDTIRRRDAESAAAVQHSAETEHRRREEAELSARRWGLINAVGLQIQAEPDLEHMLQVAGRELQRFGYECLVALWDEPGVSLRLNYISIPAVLRVQLEQLLGVPWDALRLNLAQMPLVRRALDERRAMYQASSDGLASQYLPNTTGSTLDRIVDLIGLSRHIVVPLYVRERALGVFGMWGRDLAETDLPAMTGLAQQIAVALEKGQLLEREKKRAAQLALVSEISEQAVGALDADELYRRVTRLMVQRFGYENVAVLISDPACAHVVLRAQAGPELSPEGIGYRQSWEVGLVGAAVRTGKALIVNDVRQDARYHTSGPGRDLCRSEMAVPLKRHDEVLGVLDIQSARCDAFESLDLTAMQVLATQIAAAIEKQALYAAERKRAAQLALVSAIAERITAILDPDRLIREAVTLGRERFGYHNVAVLMLDEARQELVLRAVSGAYADLFRDDYRQSLGVGLIGAAARTGTSVLVNDVSRDSRFHFPTERPTATESELVVPLRMADRILGVLDIQASVRNAFDASDVAAVETLANQIAVALENARLYAQTKSEAEVKSTLLRELSHRVKNNLSTIVGLLCMGLEDETLPRREILNETLTRVQSMAVAHTLLANSPRARVDALELSRNILAESVRQMTLPGQNVSLVVRGEAIEISAHQAATLALVFNELVTNAVKHGGTCPATELRLEVRRVSGAARIELSSPGDPAPDPTQAGNRSGGLGLQLIRTLVEKDLGGTFTHLIFPAPCGVQSVICFVPDRES